MGLWVLSGDATSVLLALDFVGTKHLGPAIAELTNQAFDLDHGLHLFLHIGLKEAAYVVFVEAVEIGGVIAADLVVEAGLKFGEDILRFDEIGADDLDATGASFGRLERIAGMAEKAESAVVEHQDELAGAGGEHRLSLISAGVALGHLGWHVGNGRLGVGREISRRDHEFRKRLDDLSWRIREIDGEGFTSGHDFGADFRGLRECLTEAVGAGAGKVVAGSRLGAGLRRFLAWQIGNSVRPVIAGKIRRGLYHGNVQGERSALTVKRYRERRWFMLWV